MLLQATKQNRNLIYFGNVRFKSEDGSSVDEALTEEIEFQLKLNRYGLGLFGSPESVPTGLWPRVFEKTAKSADECGALFCIMREYFMMSGRVPQQTEHARPTKRARVGG